ncbi:MAG: YggT family protein [Dehalococcoidia bacterium]|nr:YggT family protein [Dehalococcoidia bacterium]
MLIAADGPPADGDRQRSRAINPYVAQFTIVFIQMLTWAIIARSLLSWFPIDQSSTLYQMLWRTTEPIIEPIRRVMPQTGMIDLSPLAAIIVLIVMGQLVANLTITSA